MARLPPLLIVLMTLPGLLGRHASYVVHEHEGGADPHHHHHTHLVGHVDHAHVHHARAGDPSPSTDPSDEGVPEDGDRHGHVHAVEIVKVRRVTLVDDGRALVASCVPEPVELGFPAWPEATGSRPPRPGDPQGYPTSCRGRVIDRLVQGLGLRI